MRQYSWRNGKNGITVGSVAAVQIVDAVVADNNMRGIEMTGADGVASSLDTLTKLRGPWGLNKLINVKFIAHPLPCPACDHGFRPHIPQHEGIPGQVRREARLQGALPSHCPLLTWHACGDVAGPAARLCRPKRPRDAE